MLLWPCLAAVRPLLSGSRTAQADAREIVVPTNDEVKADFVLTVKNLSKY